MSGRPKKRRILAEMPCIEGFKPFGGKISENTAAEYNESDYVILNMEEYEVFRLMDYEGFNQIGAAEFMGVSRPTVTRIYLQARQKIAKSLVEGLPVKILGGEYEIAEDEQNSVNMKNLMNSPGMMKTGRYGFGKGCGHGMHQGCGRGQRKGLGRGRGCCNDVDAE